MKFYIFIIILGTLSTSLAEVDICRVCQGSCGDWEPQINCQMTGLIKQLPKKVKSDTKKIIFFGEVFTNPVIHPENFTNYPKTLEQFTMLNCSIRRIMPNAFSWFKEIKKLDFSDNRIEYIEDDAFANVVIGKLNLDKNPGILFAPNAFRNAQIEKITITQSNLRYFPFETFKSIFMKLKSLDISSNSLTRLDQKFVGLLTRLDGLNLENNPFNCICSLKWLPNLLNLKQFSQERDFSPALCAEPHDVRGRPLHQLTDADFYCDQPKIEKIQIDLQTNSVIDANQSLSVFLKCEASGSGKISTKWYKESQNSNFLDDIPTAKHYGSYSLLMIHQNVKNFENVICIAEDINGNATTKLSFTWPELNFHQVVQPEKKSDINISSKIYDDIDKDPHMSFFIKKQFTVMEMAGAIIGTFTVTLAFFMICCLFKNSHISRFLCCLSSYSTTKNSLDTNSKLRSSSTMKYHKASDEPYTSDHLLSVDTNNGMTPTALHLLQTPNKISKHPLAFNTYNFNASRFFSGATSSGEDSNLQQSSGERRTNVTDHLSSPGGPGSLRKRPSIQQLHNPTYEPISNGNNMLLQQTYTDTYESPAFNQNAAILAHHFNTLAATQLGPLPPLPTESINSPTTNSGGIINTQLDPSLIYQAHLQAVLASTINRGPPAGGFDLAMLQQQIQLSQMLQQVNQNDNGNS